MDKKAEILMASQILFAQYGLKKVTTDEIAREASVSKATIYKHYRNKSAIFEEVVKNEAEALIKAIDEAVSAEPTVFGKLRIHLITRLGKIQQFINFFRITQDTLTDFWPYIVQVRRWFLEAEKDIVRRILELGVETNVLQVKDISLSSHILVVGLTSVEYHWGLEEYNISLESYVDTMLDLMIDGIKKC